MTVVLDCATLTTREINVTIKRLAGEGEREMRLLNPEARHSLGVAVFDPVKIVVEGTAGYFCGAMADGPTFHILGNTGWSVGECMLNGEIVVERNAASSTGASIRGGTVVVKGHAGARTGVSQKGGLIVIGGDTGYMTGFMMQRGTMIICGDAAEGLGDSMYAGTIYLGGEPRELGSDAVLQEVTAEDRRFLEDTLARYGLSEKRAISNFKKIGSGGKLHNFSKADFEMWRVAM
ncbi:MAG: glutamate synthase [Chloroflexota bacterium]|nr:glutamate synthase [Chloroflexota bacterium]